MSLPKVVFLDRATIPTQIQIPRPSFAHDWVEYDLTSPEQGVVRRTGAGLGVSGQGGLGESGLARRPTGGGGAFGGCLSTLSSAHV